MTYLIAGLIIFLGVHMTRVVADHWRTATISRIGDGGWKGAYSVLSAIGLGLIIWGFGVARQTPEVLWTPPSWGRGAAAALMLLSFVLLAGYHSRQSHVSVAVRHPMLMGVIIFSVAHLIANSTLADVVLFGSFLAWSVVTYLSCLARDRRDGKRYPQPLWKKTIIAVVIGVVLWFVFAKWLHLWLFGVSPMTRG